MPNLPNMTLSQDNVDIEEVYDEGLYDPAEPPDSLEMLNGGLDSTNYTGGDDTVPCWAIQHGAFVTGLFQGFDNWEFQYGKQMSDDKETRVDHAALSREFFLPWDASAIVFWYQAFCRQDATAWDTSGDDGGLKEEEWDLRFQLDALVFAGNFSRLPYGRDTDLDPDVGLDSDNPGDHLENRWRYYSKCHMLVPTSPSVGTLLDKGRHTLKVSVWGGIIGPDQKQAKLLIPTGGIGVLAIR